jgi:hypothetical protein
MPEWGNTFIKVTVRLGISRACRRATYLERQAY